MGIPHSGAFIVFPEPERAELRNESLRAPTPNEVVVRTAWSLISTGTETTCYGRRFAPGTHWDQWVQYPFRPGYSLAGVVEAVGADVSLYRPGDRVVGRFPHAEYTVADAAEWMPIAEGVSDRDATWFALAFIVQNGVRSACHALGEDLVVVGLGPLGQLAVQYLHLLGPRHLIAVDPIPPRLALARARGATTVLAALADEAVEGVREETGGRMADAVYDMTGNATVFATALQLLHVRGTLVLVGDPGSPAEQHLTSAVIRNSLRIVAAHANNTSPFDSPWSHWTRANMVALFFTYLAGGRMNVADLNTDVFSPRDPQSAYQRLLRDRGATMGTHFDWSHLP